MWGCDKCGEPTVVAMAVAVVWHEQASEVAIAGLYCGGTVVATMACGSCQSWTRGVIELCWVCLINPTKIQWLCGDSALCKKKELIF